MFLSNLDSRNERQSMQPKAGKTLIWIGSWETDVLQMANEEIEIMMAWGNRNSEPRSNTGVYTRVVELVKSGNCPLPEEFKL